MVVVRLIGGLGNQLFQYAAGRALAENNLSELKLDLSGYQNYNLHNGYELNHFKIKADIATQEEIKVLTKPRTRLVKYIIKKLRLPNGKHYLESSFALNRIFFKLKSPVYIDGYWQSHKYFDSIRGTLIRELTPVNELSEMSSQIKSQIEKLNAVSIHIRRGDYISNPNTNKVHGFLGLEYYKKAIAHITSLVSEPFYFVFSDDIGWAKENLNYLNNVIFVDHNSGKNSYEDMILMAACKHHVIANSSFSWWGAWLGSNPEKVVIAPLNWFADNSRDISDLCPPSWYLI
ncbi:alpha-1,2-fucosyltransferase [Methylophilus glucosoxydans]|uniref:Alpha-1,2-fucosyltransferase n=1 Tax=Methylophilus glucosoxydans TaxID=752553 RepID=A0ABW3GIC8_9PROT